MVDAITQDTEYQDGTITSVKDDGNGWDIDWRQDGDAFDFSWEWEDAVCLKRGDLADDLVNKDTSDADPDRS